MCWLGPPSCVMNQLRLMRPHTHRYCCRINGTTTLLYLFLSSLSSHTHSLILTVSLSLTHSRERERERRTNYLGAVLPNSTHLLRRWHPTYRLWKWMSDAKVIALPGAFSPIMMIPTGTWYVYSKQIPVYDVIRDHTSTNRLRITEKGFSAQAGRSIEPNHTTTVTQRRTSDPLASAARTRSLPPKPPSSSAHQHAYLNYNDQATRCSNCANSFIFC